MTLKSCLVLFSIKPMITLTNLRKKQQNGYRGAGFGRGQVSEFFGRSPRHREMVPAHRGRTSRHREMVPAHRGRAFLLNSLCPSGISPFKRGRKIEKQTIPAPPSEGGAPRRGEGVRNSDAAPLPMESFRKRGPKISRDTYIRE